MSLFWGDGKGSDDAEHFAYVLQRMGEDHWTALEYVEKYGLEPACEAVSDLEEWGLVYRVAPALFVTTLGEEVLEAQVP